METDILTFSDELGPSKIVHIYNPKNDLRAILAIDNVAAGPSIGGIRMAKDVTLEEAFRLARAMTLKNAAAGLAHGGGKAVIQADPKTLSKLQKEALIRSFALAIEHLSEYIPGPDMGTDEVCMAWIKDEIGRAVGLPRELGGIPLDELGATGLGLTEAAKTAGDFYGVDLKGAKVCIQGFGAVGKHAARFFSQLGALIISIADSQGTVTNTNGLDLETLTAVKKETGSVIHYEDGEKGDTLEIVKVPCDIWIPCARPDIIHVDNVSKLQTKLIVQGANIPISREAEEILFKNGVHVIPDFIANAGGVICAAVEYHGGSQQAALSMVKEKISFNTDKVIRQSWEQKIPPREVAIKLALTRVKKAMQLRRN